MVGLVTHLQSSPSTQHGLVSMLMKSVTLNQLGLPEGIYRPDLLPDPTVLLGTSSKGSQAIAGDPLAPGTSYEGLHVGDVTHDDTHDDDRPNSNGSPARFASPISIFDQASSQPPSLANHPDVRSAYYPLSYHEGFPTYDGVPFWVQLPFEPPEAYKCFELYLRQSRSGARQIYILQDDSSFPQQISNGDLHSFNEMYFWAPRARSYDMFNAAHRRKERERRAIETEDDHYILANRLMSIATAYLDDQEDELIEMMSPKMLLEFIKTSATLRRISAGLPASGPSASQASEGPRGESTSLEVIMRTIAQENGHSIDNNTTELIDGKTSNRNKLQLLLKDENALALAQELVLRVNKQPAPLNNIKPEMETV